MYTISFNELPLEATYDLLDLIDARIELRRCNFSLAFALLLHSQQLTQHNVNSAVIVDTMSAATPNGSLYQNAIDTRMSGSYNQKRAIN